MGGYGSGFQGQAKATTRERQRLTIGELGNLYPGAVRSWRWTRGGAVHVTVEADALALTYRQPDGGEWRQTINREWVPCPFGGSRPWFECPHCGRHCGTLYLGRYGFTCRTCSGVNYPSTRETQGDRAVRKAGKIRARLGWVPGVAFGHGPKPKGMHWQTFWRLVREHDQNAGIFWAGTQTLMERMQGRLSAGR